MYQHLKDIDWTPSIEQVVATLPCAIQEKYRTTELDDFNFESIVKTHGDLLKPLFLAAGRPILTVSKSWISFLLISHLTEATEERGKRKLCYTGTTM